MKLRSVNVWRAWLVVLLGFLSMKSLGSEGGGYDVIGNYRVYRMQTNTDNSCPIYYTPIEPNPTYNLRDPSIALYQASSSITFEPGFGTLPGDAFVAQIVPPEFGVPPATNLTGTADVNLNWIQSSTFDENGNLIGDGKEFYDNAGRQVQSQEKVLYRATSGALYTHVLASQKIRDAYGRDAATTMEAPIDFADFSYRTNFLQHNASGAVYGHQNFDLYNNGSTTTDNTITPQTLWDASTGSPVQGTLAWYYSTQNTWEPYTPVTGYPYTRQTYYQDGTGDTKKSAGAGEQLRMGSTHENSGYITPVVNELSNYLQIRNTFFATTDLGALPTVLQNQAVQQVSQDGNGNEVVQIQDQNGKTLMTARPGSDVLPPANSVTLKALPYSLTMPTVPSGAGCSLGSQLVSFYGSGTTFTLTNPAGQVLTINGPQNGGGVEFTATDWGTVIQSDAPFSIVYQDEQGTGCTLVPAEVNSPTPAAGVAKEYYFKILTNSTPVTLTGNYTLYDMSTETTTALLTGNLLNQGFYKVVVNTGIVTLTYGNSFADVSYNFYNQKGLLVASIAPEGVKRLQGAGIGQYASRSALPFTTLYTYDVQGRLVSSQYADKKTPTNTLGSTYIYRMDGKIRFSQNPIQAAAGSFSYTNYDPFGRPVESGQYLPDVNGIVFGSAAMTNILENTGSGGGLTTGTKTDVIMSQYDITDNSYYTNTNNNILFNNYSQNAFNLAGAVSVTRRYSSIVNNAPVSTNLVSATWFNYDEEKKMVWQIQYINGLGAGIADVASYKTTDYTYDVLGHLTNKVFQSGQADAFTHLYTYDPVNQQLLTVSTTTAANPTPLLQATYYYYLHGGIKRMELAANLQGIDYTYTLQGALKSINNSNKMQDPGGDGSVNSFAPDAFGEVLDYFSGDYANGRTGAAAIAGVNAPAPTTDSYAGNIKAMSWYSEKPTVLTGVTDAPTAYVYQYDPKYQFTAGAWGSVTFSNTTTPATFTPTNTYGETLGNGTTAPYDGNGNIQSLQRTGNTAGQVTDAFSYQYGNSNNQLTGVTNTLTNQPYSSYSYDANGQLTGEVVGGNSRSLVYDVTGNVTTVTQGTGNMLAAAFVYDETGKRIKKLTYSNSGTLLQVTYYVGDAIYTQAVMNGTSFGPVTATQYQIRGIDRIGVYVSNTSPVMYAYELKDHLGNVRAVIAATPGTTAYNVQSSSDYYPYGGVINAGGTYRYGYQGQNSEMDMETGWNAFELRMYDSKIGRWLQYDPAGQFFSPYTGMGNDPVSSTDPDGAFDWYAHQNADGQVSLVNDIGNHADAQTIEGQLYVNVGESSLSEDAATSNANGYFASAPLYFGNYHSDAWDAENLEEQAIYSNPSIYSSFAGSAPWIDVGKGEEEAGVRRFETGNNPRILEYLQSTIDPSDAMAQTQKTAWCACFLNWELNKVGVAGSGSALAYSFKTYGQKLDRLAYGAIIVLNFSHVTQVIGKNRDGRIVTLGGNQGPDPHGVTIGTVDSSSIIAIRYPSGFTPNYNLPYYKVHGAPLSFNSTH